MMTADVEPFHALAASVGETDMQTSRAIRMPITARGLVVPDRSRPFSRHQWHDIALAVISEAEGNAPAERYLLDRLEGDLGVTPHDRLVADHGPDVIAGQHCSLDRPRRPRGRAGKPAQDPSVFTKADLVAIAAAERKIRNASPTIQEEGRGDLQRVVDRRELRILSHRAAVAEAEATSLAELRDQSVKKRRDGLLRRFDGLDMLRSSGAITDFGLRCAQRYGELYKATQPRSAYRSGLAEQGVITVDPRTEEEQATAYQAARDRLLDAMGRRSAIDRQIVSATSAKALLLLQQVAGEGATIASLASSGPIRTVFRREVIAAIAVLEVIYSPPKTAAAPATRPEAAPIRPTGRKVAETTICVDEDGAFVREVIVLRSVERG